MDPLGCGRNVAKMVSLAKVYADKANFIMCTGFQKGSLYDNNNHWSLTYPQNKVIDLLISEIEEGMDLYSYSGPIISRTNYKAGLVKAGLSYNKITQFEYNSLLLVAEVAKKTNCCISIHTEQGSMCKEAIEILEKQKVDLQKVVFCHMHRNLDPFYLESLLEKGVNLCFDGIGRIHAVNVYHLFDIFNRLFPKYIAQILLAMDCGRDYYHAQQIGEYVYTEGISSLTTSFRDLFIKEFNENTYNTLLIENPIKVLSL